MLYGYSLLPASKEKNPAKARNPATSKGKGAAEEKWEPLTLSSSEETSGKLLPAAMETLKEHQQQFKEISGAMKELKREQCTIRLCQGGFTHSLREFTVPLHRHIRIKNLRTSNMVSSRFHHFFRQDIGRQEGGDREF